MLDDLRFGWAVGLFEGEGSISHTAPPCVRLSLASTDRDVLLRFSRIVGVGSIGGWQGKAPRKYTWQWYVDGEAAAALLRRFRPYLGARRAARADAVLAFRSAYIAEATEPRACDRCGESFSPSFSAGQLQRYCSARCRELARNARRKVAA